MLHGISWTAFWEAVLLLLVPYYAAVAFLFLPEGVQKRLRQLLKKGGLPVILAFGVIPALKAQTADGNNGISQANTLIRSYFQTGTQLMYAVSALVGLVGAVRVFVLWNSGHREEMTRAASAWFGSCVFIAVVALIIQSFFGL